MATFSEEFRRIRQQRSQNQEGSITLPSTVTQTTAKPMNNTSGPNSFIQDFRNIRAQRDAQKNQPAKTPTSEAPKVTNYAPPDTSALDGYTQQMTAKKTEIDASNTTIEDLSSRLKVAEEKTSQLAAYAKATNNPAVYTVYYQVYADYQTLVNEYNTAIKSYGVLVDEYNAIRGQAMEIWNAYETWRNSLRGEDVVLADVQALDDQAADLRNQRAALEKQAQEYTELLTMRRGNPDQMVAWQTQLGDLNTQMQAIDQQINGLQQQRKLYNDELYWSRETMYTDLDQSADFANMSSAGGTKIEADSSGLWNPYGKGDIVYDFINDISGMRKKVRARNVTGREEYGEYTKYAQMEESEIARYNYLYNTKGKDAADKYLEFLSDRLVRRQGEAVAATKDTTWEKLAYAPMAGLDRFKTGVQQLFSEEALPTSYVQYAGQKIREDMSGLGGGVYDFIQTMSNMAPSILLSTAAAAVTGGLGAAPAVTKLASTALGTGAMAGSAGGNAYQQKVQEGYDPEAARNYATLVGASEGALQYALGGIGKLGGIGGNVAKAVAGIDNAFVRFALQYGGKMAAEGTEEALQEVLEPLFAVAALGEEYEGAKFEDIAYSFLLGAASAGVFEFGDTLSQVRAPKKTGQAFHALGDDAVNSLIEAGLAAEEGSTSYKIAQKLQKMQQSGKKISDYQLGRLVAEESEFASAAAAEVVNRQEPTTKQPEPQTTIGQPKPQPTESTAEDDDLPFYMSEETPAQSGVMLPTAEEYFQQRENTQPTTQKPVETPTEQNPGMLPTAEDADRNRRAAKATTELERSGILADATDEMISSAQHVSETTGRQIAFYKEAARAGEGVVNGYYNPQTKTIMVNAASPKATQWTLGHELTHTIETAGAYQKLRDLVFYQYRGDDLQKARNSINALYGKKGVSLTPTGVDQEIVANYVADHLFTDQQAIDAIVRDDRSLGRKILDFIDRLLKRFSGTARDRDFLVRARKYYAQALESTPESIPANVYDSSYANFDRQRSNLENALAAGDITEEEYEAQTDLMEQDAAGKGIGLNRYSIGGVKAKSADMAALAQAKQMDEDGVAAETIFQETGWYIGADGKWRFEIDDSGMRYSRRGDIDFRKNHAGYDRYRTLIEKANDYLNGNSDDWLTTEEQQELTELQGTWGNTFTVDGRISPDALPMTKLSDYLRHDDLFANYPKLRNTKVRFLEMMRGERGSYDPQHDIITLSEDLRNAPESTLVHEIQHAIQEAEDFTRGASPESWNAIRQDIIDTLSGARQNLGLWLNDIGYDAFVKDSLAKVANKERTLSEHWEAVREFKENSRYAEQIAACEAEIADFEGQLRMLNSLGNGEWATPDEMYWNTAGEIEARNVSERRMMTAEQRRETMPNTGDERTVFAENMNGRRGGWMSAKDPNATSIKEQIEASKDKLNEMTVVASANVPTNLQSKREAAKWLTSQLSRWGGQVDRQGYGYIFFSKDDIDQGLRYADTPEEKAALAVLPQVLKRGIEIDQHGNHKAREKQSITFAAPVELNGIRGNMGVVINKHGNYYYAHRIVLPDGSVFKFSDKNKDTARELSKGVTVSGSLAKTTSAVSDGIISRTSDSVKQFSIGEQENVETTQQAAVAIPAKAQPHVKRVQRNLYKGLAEAFGVPKFADRKFLQDLITGLTNEYLQTGRVSQETLTNIFERGYESGIVVDREFYDNYKHIKDHLRTQPITISDYDAANIPDYNLWRKKAFGTLRIVNEGGLPVDSAYQELMEMAPGLFPDTIVNPAEQLMQMYEVAKAIHISEQTLNEVYGDDAATYKQWARNEFDTAVSGAFNDLKNIKRYVDERNIKEKVVVLENIDEVKTAYKELKAARRIRDKVVAKTLLTKHDNMQVGKLLRGEIELKDLNPQEDNVNGITAVYEASKEYDRLAGIIARWKQQRKSELYELVDQDLTTANSWHDKSAGILYSRETMERNIRDIIDDKDLAERIIQIYFAPVHKAAAAANRTKEAYRNRVRAMNLSTKVDKGNEVSEAYAVQLVGEAEDNIRMIQDSKGRMNVRDGKTEREWEDVIFDLWQNNPNLDREKIHNAVEEFRKIYDELFVQMNEVRVDNGYEPVNYRHGYFPHFQKDSDDGILGLFGKALGVSTEVTALPTTINGLTHTFRPGIRWIAAAQERTGFQTEYDAVEGFDRYIEGVADVIHQTENIQRLRALSDRIRYRTGDEGLRRQIDEINADPTLDEETKRSKIKEVYENGKYSLSNFVVELEEYTNLLANKKSRADRNMEQAIGRRGYNLVKALENRIAANMVAINPASWLTNFIALTQGNATLNRFELLRGMWRTLKAYKEDDGMVARSNFLTNRRGSDPLVRTTAQKWSATLSKPMEWIDSFTADSLVRARYDQNLKAGMSEQSAIDEADAWVAGVMADRSKGSMPTLFNRSNPLTKLFTQFQLEVNNQISYLTKDMPKEAGKALSWRFAKMLFKFALGAWMFNELYEYLIGRRPALDPIGILNDTVGDLTGYELPNVVELGVGAIAGDLPSFEVEEQGLYDAATNLGTSIVENIPFVGGLWGGGRLPISSALPNLANLAKAALNDKWDTKKRWTTAAKELVESGLYWFPPFGGGQIKKILEGIDAVARGGSYTVDSDGESVLQYPISGSNAWEYALNYAQAMTFGKTSLPGGREWIESGFDSLSANATAAYKGMIDVGVDGYEAFDLVQGLGEFTGAGRSSQQRDYLRDSEISEEGKAMAYYGMLASDKEKELMDELADTVDVGNLATVLMAIKDAGELKGAEASNGKREAIIGAAMTDEAKKLVYRYTFGTKNDNGTYATSREEDILAFEDAGMDFDTFLIAQNAYTEINEAFDSATEKATEFSRWCNAQGFTEEQAAVVRDSFKYYTQMPAEAGNYDKFVGVGLTDEDSYALSNALNALEPLPSKTSVAPVQKWRAVVDTISDSDDQMSALEVIMTDSAYEKLQVATSMRYGIDAETYVTAYELLPYYDENANGSYTGAEVAAALNHTKGKLTSNGIELPTYSGRLTTAQKAILWQLLTGNTSAKNNPFDVDIGWRVLKARGIEPKNKGGK